MGSVTIRNLDDAIKHKARLAAAANGRSLEAELRLLLERTYASADKARQSKVLPKDDWVQDLVRTANGAGDGVFDPELQPLREFDIE